MTEVKTTTSNYWTNTQAFALAAVSLVLGFCGGLLLRKATATPRTPQAIVAPEQAGAPASMPANVAPSAATPSALELKHAADTQAAPLLEKLKAAPTNTEVLTNLGNTYYDAKQYPLAIQYYERALQTDPRNASVRTDLGTAYWYTGDADTAIAQFQKALSYEPTKPDTLFNLGIVEYQGKKDSKQAIAAWQKLLQTNPAYENKDRVLQLIAEAQSH